MTYKTFTPTMGTDAMLSISFRRETTFCDCIVLLCLKIVLGKKLLYNKRQMATRVGKDTTLRRNIMVPVS